jgi:hypothetical protein
MESVPFVDLMEQDAIHDKHYSTSWYPFWVLHELESRWYSSKSVIFKALKLL